MINLMYEALNGYRERNEELVAILPRKDGKLVGGRSVWFALIKVNGGYTTEEFPSRWVCGQWYKTPEDAVRYYNEVIKP